ncbi:hypothetical protein B0O80DRAFT_283238, partial [Mortierella sp. GBAus27b]
ALSPSFLHLSPLAHEHALSLPLLLCFLFLPSSTAPLCSRALHDIAHQGRTRPRPPYHSPRYSWTTDQTTPSHVACQLGNHSLSQLDSFIVPPQASCPSTASTSPPFTVPSTLASPCCPLIRGNGNNSSRAADAVHPSCQNL